jgi:uncharacterized protein YciW
MASQQSQTAAGEALPDDTSMLRQSLHAVSVSELNPSIDDAQSELDERLAQIKAHVHPFLNAHPEDATFLPDALYRYIRENKIYGLNDDKE